MLKQILAELENTTSGLSLEEIAQRIGKDPRVVEGMLDMLVRMGMLIEVDNVACSSCPLHDTCRVIATTERTFSLAT
ncbi:MAG TPA: hypothetical protein G4O11_09645 [Anaerolineae bacterium]|nr:hypothetical protein [Anaerolineae bacterium]